MLLIWCQVMMQFSKLSLPFCTSISKLNNQGIVHLHDCQESYRICRKHWRHNRRQCFKYGCPCKLRGCFSHDLWHCESWESHNSILIQGNLACHPNFFSIQRITLVSLDSTDRIGGGANKHRRNYLWIPLDSNKLLRETKHLTELEL